MVKATWNWITLYWVEMPLLGGTAGGSQAAGSGGSGAEEGSGAGGGATRAGEATEASGAAESGAAVERTQVPARYKWNLERIYADWDRWEKDFAEIEAALPSIKGRQGRLPHGARSLLDAVDEILAVRRKLEVVMTFASMKSDEDTRDGENTARRGRSRSLATRFAEAASWFEAEFLSLAPAMLVRFVEQEPRLELYDHYFDDIQRSREHRLTPEQEALLAAAGDMAMGAGQIFNALNNADLRFPKIADEKGERIELTKARYSRLIKSGDRQVRQEAFEAFHDSYGALINTLAATLDANVKSHKFYAEARKHPATLEAALHPNAIPPQVFHTLLATTEGKLAIVHRYTELRRRVLGLDPLREHDLYVPLFPQAEFRYEYEEAQRVLLAALQPLGEEYLSIVREGYDSGWIDVQENVGKRSGAYSSGAYDTSPYILLNWSDQLSDTFTLAHEMGHSVHTYLANRNQPYVYADYPIFTAEVASTCNEMLLLDYLLKQASDPDRKLFLLDHYLAQINNTVVRQTMFAEFEYKMHRLGEEGETLTADLLGDLYLQLLTKYWGEGVVFDRQRSRISWSRIPHFYYNYYVYQYATAYAAAAALSRRILSGEGGARASYLDLLRSGNRHYPVDTLKRAGVDMTQPQPIQDVYTLFGNLLDQVSGLLSEKETR